MSLPLRDLVSRRVAFEYEGGARVTGHLAGCLPASGPVLLATLARAEFRDARGELLGRADEVSLVPAILLSVEVDDGPRGRRA